MKKALVYVVVITYNGFKWLDKCFGSLSNSSLPVKVIAIDNASNDGTPEYIRKHYCEVDLFENSKNLGFGQANNIGIRKAYDAGADYVFLLNQDAWVQKNTIENLVWVSHRNPEFGIISPIHLAPDLKGLDLAFSCFVIPQICPGFYSDVFSGEMKKELYETEFVNAAAWLLTRRCIETVGGFSPVFFMYAEDNNYAERVYYHNLKIGVYPKSFIVHDKDDKFTYSGIFKDQKHRNSLLKYSNPNYFESIFKEISINKRSVFKSLLKLNFISSKKHFDEFYNLKKLSKLLKGPVEESRKPGMSFL